MGVRAGNTSRRLAVALTLMRSHASRWWTGVNVGLMFGMVLTCVICPLYIPAALLAWALAHVTQYRHLTQGCWFALSLLATPYALGAAFGRIFSPLNPTETNGRAEERESEAA